MKIHWGDVRRWRSALPFEYERAEVDACADDGDGGKGEHLGRLRMRRDITSEAPEEWSQDMDLWERTGLDHKTTWSCLETAQRSVEEALA